MKKSRTILKKPKPFDVSSFCRNRFDLRNLVAISELLTRVGLVVLLFYVVQPRVSYVGLGIFSGTVVLVGRGDPNLSGRDLPFADRSFDYVHSSAVIEHVGDRQKQTCFLREAWRVSRKGMFVTTPNRWFPIEFHTVLPLLHWLPPRRYRRTLTTLGRDFFAREDNLNLLSRNDLARLADRAGIDRATLDTVALLGWPTNLILTARKSAG